MITNLPDWVDKADFRRAFDALTFRQGKRYRVYVEYTTHNQPILIDGVCTCVKLVKTMTNVVIRDYFDLYRGPSLVKVGELRT